ncbi:glutamine amidotransferase class-I [Thermoanaerobacter mathranii subsp. mathranii str. A3]|uniref:Glutamine amidotransferase class-I n=1 Tax=Thermoanaerobacter mathranii subsp. mathranii (strain DSM 11426 / CCUG 53645 / CIP 108742 / A3) TaxID=583358 RepID=A0ABN3Z2Y8_THEM3|nr:type 1 glutamine amidotransferase [Thermoanaerobacter mathranii]ADH61036.1 glutamine amidotransferase class-I [Thermoanaerobacter mathranii subsp. mathranii str. A3]
MQVLIIQHVRQEGPGLIAEIFSKKGWKLDIRIMDQPGTILPKKVADYKAVIILGGPMGAYEEPKYPYLYQVQELVRDAIERQIPILGICLGGQLIARALGATVKPNSIKEIGWYKIHLTEAGKKAFLFRDLPEEFWAFQWHGDTFELPEGAVLLAEGDTCTNQAFAYQECAWALQFHPEVTPIIIDYWAEIYQEELIDFAGPEAVNQLKEETKRLWEKNQEVFSRFWANFCRLLDVYT